MVQVRDLTQLIEEINGSNTYVNVWNLKAEFIIAGHSEDELRLTEEQKKGLEKLKEYVIYTVNDGAINISGVYRLDSRSYEVLEMILKGDVEDALNIISEITEEDIEEKASDLIDAMEEGDYVTVRNSALDYGCWDGCQGYHNIQYVAMLKGKLVLIDNGCAHHSHCNGDMKIVKELSRDEAVELLAQYIKQVSEKYDYTKAELDDFQLDSELDGKMHLCERSNRVYFDYEDELICEE